MENNFKTKSQFDILCKIGNIDISNDIYEILVIRSIEFPYTSYLIKLNTDADKRKFFDKINPNMDIKLTIDCYNDYETIITTWSIDLIYILDEYDISSKYYVYNQDTDKQMTYNQFILFAIPKNSLSSCIEPVNNKIYFNKTIKDILSDLTPCKINYLTEIENNNIIEQYMSEKQSFITELRRINTYYGFYNGPLYLNFNEFQNKLLIGNLTDMLKKENYITLEHVSISGTERKIHEKTLEELSNFYIIRTDINITENLSTFVLKNNYSLRVVNYPNDYIYNEKRFDLENDILDKYSPIDKKFDLNMNEILKKKFKNYCTNVGFNYDYTYFLTNFIKDTKNLVNISFYLDKFIDLESFYPGRICLFKTQHQRYIQFMGKYILYSCLFTFSRSQSTIWGLNTEVSMSRTNLEY